MRGIVDDVRYAIRMLIKNRGFSVASVLTLVTGILLNTAVFGIVNALWFRPLPFRADQQIVIIAGRNPDKGVRAGVSYQDLLDLHAQSRTLQGIAAFTERSFNLGGVASSGAAPERVRGGAMSPNTMEVLGIRMLLGRGFTAQEQEAGTPVALIGEGLWRNRFASDPQIAGKEIKLDGRQVTVIGVLPYAFRFLYAGYQVITPLPLEALRAPRSDRSLAVLARLQDHIPIEQARAELGRIAQALAQSYPADNAGWTVVPLLYRQAIFAQAERMYTILLAAAALVLFIVCANISNLFLAKAAGRQKEIAIRMALGARRLFVVRQMLVEGMLVALLSGACAAIAAYWLRQILVASYPELATFTVDYRVMAYTLFMSLLAGVVFGLAPALAASRPDVNETLKSGGRAGSAIAHHRLRNALVVAQLAVGLMLLAGTGLLAKTIAALRFIDMGYRIDNLLTSDISLNGERYAQPEARRQFWTELCRRSGAMPGIDSATLSSYIPMYGFPHPEEVELEGAQPKPGGEYLRLVKTVAGPGYLDAIGLRLLSGRDFTTSDRPGAMAVAIINEALANQLWQKSAGAATPLGKRIRTGRNGPWLTIVGVTGNVRQALSEPASPEILTSCLQFPPTSMTLVLRTSAEPKALASAVRRQVRDLDPDLPVSAPSTSEDLMENFYPRVMVAGMGTFAAVATLLAALGLYGVISHFVVCRTQEIGVRVALGAGSTTILRLVLGHAVRFASIGAAIGLAGAIALARVLSGFLYGVSPVDPLVFGIVAVVLCAVAIGAGLVPALRAARLDPLVALRYE